MATGEALFERVVQATGELNLFSKRPRAAVDPLLASGGSRPGGGEQGWCGVQGWLRVCAACAVAGRRR